MSKIQLALDHDFIGILAATNFDNFTVLELRSAYLALPGHRELDKVQTQRIVYRQILRLQKKDLLKRTESKTTKKIRYQKTELFYSAMLIPRAQRTELTRVVHDDVPIESRDQLHKHLIDKLKQYELELLSSMGESDEYKELYSEFPELKSQLQERYNQARDYSSKLLGRVKAIETLIEQQKRI